MPLASAFDGGVWGTYGPHGRRPYHRSPNVWQQKKRKIAWEVGKFLGKKAAKAVAREPMPYMRSWDPKKKRIRKAKDRTWWGIFTGDDFLEDVPKEVHSAKSPTMVKRKRGKFQTPTRRVVRRLFPSGPSRSSGVGRVRGHGFGPRSPISPLPRRYRYLSRRRKMKFHAGNSSYAKMFKGKKVLGIGMIRKKGVQIEFDSHTNVSGARTVYFGHYSHPSKSVLNVLGYALAKYLVTLSCKEVPQSMDQTVGQYGGVAHSIFTIRIFYLTADEQNTALNTFFTVTSGMTYAQIGEGIRDMLYTIVGNTTATNSPKITLIKVEPLDSNAPNIATLATAAMIPASELKIAVHGHSELKIQNATLGDALGSTDIHDITANPIEGKRYFGDGSFFRNKYEGNVVSLLEGNLSVDSLSGLGSFPASAPTDIKMRRVLEFPPTHKQWYGLRGHQYVRLNPGKMTKSLVKGTHMLPLNRWLTIYRRQLDDVHANHDATSAPTSMGKSVWFGFDKMIHDSGDDTTIVNVEYHLKLASCVLRTKKKQITASYPVFDTT